MRVGHNGPAKEEHIASGTNPLAFVTGSGNRAAPHALFVDEAVDRIEKQLPSLVAGANTVVTDGLPSSYRTSVARLLADTVRRMH